MTCNRIVVLALLLAAAHARANAQTGPSSAERASRADTVVIEWFSLYGGSGGVAGQPVTLQHRLGGNLTPTHFRVSRLPDFTDASWQPYPSGVPRWSSPSFSGSCRSPGSARLVAYFQVRALRSTRSLPPSFVSSPQSFVVSNVARDTACVLIGS